MFIAYGLPSTSQPQAEQPTQPGYPPQPVTYDYSQWQGTQNSTGGGEEHRQQELESSSSSRREGVESVGSGDSHVTEKKTGEEAKESIGKDENKKGTMYGYCTNYMNCA